MKNVDIVALGTTLREELEFCKKNDIKDPLKHMVDSWYVDIARLETVKGFTVLSARYAYKFFNITICYEGGYYVAYDADIVEGADMEPPKRSDVQTSNEGYLLQAYSYDSLDAYEEYMKGVKYSDPIVGENGFVAPPVRIDNDVEDIPF